MESTVASNLDNFINDSNLLFEKDPETPVEVDAEISELERMKKCLEQQIEAKKKQAIKAMKGKMIWKK